MGLFDGQENAVLDSLFGGGSPGTYDLALSSTQPSDDGTNITEPSGGGYARLSISNSGASFNAASGGSKTNAATFEFSAATASWGAALTHWLFYDGSTPIIWGTLSPSKTIDTGDILRIPAGQMTLTAD